MEELSTTDVDSLRGRVQVIDVRESDELDAGIIPGAIHIPKDTVPHRLGYLERRLVVVCQSGARAQDVTRELRRLGRDARFMAGGMNRWTAEHRVLVPCC